MDEYADSLDATEIHLLAIAGVLGRFRTALLEGGYSEEQAFGFAKDWFVVVMTEAGEPTP